MTKIVVEDNIAEEIRKSVGPVELVDQAGNRVALVRRPPTPSEVEFARSRIAAPGPKFTFDQLIEKIKATEPK